MPAMAGPSAGAAKIQIPRWIQLVGLPILLLLLWVIAGAARHVVFLFLVAALIAFLLNPIVRTLTRVWIPRGFGVALVYLSFFAILLAVILALGSVVVDQTKSSATRVNDYFTVALDFVEGAAIGTIKFLFALVLVIVVSIYMLLDMPRLGRVVDRRFPPHPGSDPLLHRIERSLASYVRGQLLLSLIIGTSAGLGMWLLGTLGWVPGADKYAALFGAWVAITELIPYIGPWLGAIPPFIYALVVHPVSAIWVGLLFLGIHQLEGHVVVPNVMGSALRLHPLLVIFGLLAGGEIYGLPGALVALPLLAAGRAIWEFFGERVTLESWAQGSAIPVEVEVEETRVAPLPPPDPPAAASR